MKFDSVKKCKSFTDTVVKEAKNGDFINTKFLYDDFYETYKKEKIKESSNHVESMKSKLKVINLFYEKIEKLGKQKPPASELAEKKEFTTIYSVNGYNTCFRKDIPKILEGKALSMVGELEGLSQELMSEKPETLQGEEDENLSDLEEKKAEISKKWENVYNNILSLIEEKKGEYEQEHKRYKAEKEKIRGIKELKNIKNIIKNNKNLSKELPKALTTASVAFKGLGITHIRARSISRYLGNAAKQISKIKKISI